jgi:hypothetical protein
MGPSFDGSLLWHATQLARKTALPLFQSGFWALAGDFSDSFEQAVANMASKPNATIP